MKRIFFSVIYVILCMLDVSAQKEADNVCISSKSPVCIDLPGRRNVYGGTIINVTYVDGKVTETIKNAFEYACKIVEENVPTTYPLNVNVEFLNLPNDCLAEVDTYNGVALEYYGGMVFDKVFTKRYAQIWGYPEFETEADEWNFYRGTPDATISFANKRGIFDYNINPDNINPNKYDFVTVAIQALLKAVGFTCKAYAKDKQLIRREPANIFTKMLLSDEPLYNYTYATSGNVTISAPLSSKKWALVSDAPYKHGISLCYFVDSADNETAIMQYGISKGSCIRYIGSSIHDFFSYCGWDRQIATGGNGGISVDEANTNDVLKFQEIIVPATMATPLLSSSKETIDASYLSSRHEVQSSGDFVLLKDGSWKPYTSRSSLYENELYARSADGFLRLKKVRREAGVGGSYVNWKVSYQLSEYIPQKPVASLNGYQESSDLASLNGQNRRVRRKTSDEDLFMDVEIGFKNIEGTEYIMVEQTDADYPVPYSFLVEDPGSGTFVTYMNKRYPSTFKITYINSHGQTTGEPFTIDLTSEQASKLSKLDFTSAINGEDILYDIKNRETVSLSYTIADVISGKIIETGKITGTKGAINTSALENGFYVFSVFDGGDKVSELKWNKK